MKKLFPICLLTLLSACQSVPADQKTPIGGAKDAHGCLTAAGYTFSQLHHTCVRTFEIADIRIPVGSLAAFVILSDDKATAELFHPKLAGSVLMSAVKGGYVSDDDKVRLQNTTAGWRVVLP